jgi:hypothetical protein
MDVAIDQESQIRIRRDECEEDLPLALDRLCCSIREMRTGCLHALAVFFAGQFRGDAIEPYLNDIIKQLSLIISDPFSPTEHDEALTLTCLLCQQRFSAFDPFTRVVVGTLLPRLGRVAQDETLEYFASAFLAAFGTDSDDFRVTVISRLAQLLTNKKARTVEFTPTMTAELLSSLSLVLAAAPPPVAAIQFFAEIQDILASALSASKLKILLAALDLVSVVYESMKFVEKMIEVEGFDGELPMPLIQFCNAYVGRFMTLPGLMVKKVHQRAVTWRCQVIIKTFDGAPTSSELVLNSQLVTITGARPATLIGAIRRVTQDHFAEQMCDNPLIHDMLGIDLMTRFQALKRIRENKSAIQQDRVITRRQREKAISKARKKKAKREEYHSSEEDVE